MEEYIVGKEFPYIHHVRHDGALPEFTDSAFNLICLIKSLTESEIEEFSSGQLETRLFILNGMPFITFKFGQKLLFEASFNILKNPYEFNKDWLSGDGNIVSLFLVDRRDNILKALRVVGFPENILSRLRACLQVQQDFGSMAKIDAAIQTIMADYTTAEIFDKSILTYKFR